MTKIGLWGDVHGNAEWASFSLSYFQQQGITTIVQLGDFGFQPGGRGRAFLKHVERALEEYGQELLVIPGNHEDYDYIESLDGGFETSSWLVDPAYEQILISPRVMRWDFDGVTFLNVSGAPSVDRQWRLQGQAMKPGTKYWWAQEAVTDVDVQDAILDGSVEVVLAHDAPHVPGIDRVIAGNPHGFQKIDLDYAEEGRKRMDEILFATRPLYWFHGHYHMPNEEMIPNQPLSSFLTRAASKTHVLSLNKDMSNYSLATFDTDTNEIEIFDILAPFVAWRGRP